MAHSLSQLLYHSKYEPRGTKDAAAAQGFRRLHSAMSVYMTRVRVG